MKRVFRISIFVLLLCAIIFCLGVLFGSRDPIENHKRAWFKAWNRIIRKQTTARTLFASRWDDLLGSVLGRVDDDRALRQHEQALMQLGYLAKHDFFVTNQILTREFNSNFFGAVGQRFGTNGESIWLCRFSTNRDGWHATLPASDIAEWDRIFRECVTRYASNVPPPILTNLLMP